MTNRRKPAISLPNTTIETITAKQIAQTFVINDIIMHELILEAINDIEESIHESGNTYSKSDITNRICVLVSRDELSSQFDIKREDILWAIKTEYVDEILSLAMYNISHNTQKK
jgi:hypothetical protein